MITNVSIWVVTILGLLPGSAPELLLGEAQDRGAHSLLQRHAWKVIQRSSDAELVVVFVIIMPHEVV